MGLELRDEEGGRGARGMMGGGYKLEGLNKGLFPLYVLESVINCRLGVEQFMYFMVFIYSSQPSRCGFSSW